MDQSKRSHREPEQVPGHTQAQEACTLQTQAPQLPAAQNHAGTHTMKQHSSHNQTALNNTASSVIVGTDLRCWPRYAWHEGPALCECKEVCHSLLGPGGPALHGDTRFLQHPTDKLLPREGPLATLSRALPHVSQELQGRRQRASMEKGRTHGSSLWAQATRLVAAFGMIQRHTDMDRQRSLQILLPVWSTNSKSEQQQGSVKT
jgi:hypothetical protein